MLLAPLLFSLNLIFLQIGIMHTSIVNASILGNIHPVFVVAGALLLRVEKPTLRMLFGITLALAGILWLGGHHTGFSGIAWGDTLATVSTMFFGMWILCVTQLRRRLPTVVMVIWNLMLSTVILLPVGLLLGECLLPSTWRGWALIVAFGLIVNVVGQGAMTYAMGRLSPSVTSASILTVPVISVLLGWLLLDEPPTVAQGVAGACVIAGVAITQGQRARTGARLVTS
jgi:drug/metabolite transporter (DMT)-like permease